MATEGHPGRVFMVTVTSGHDLSARYCKSKDELKVYDNEFAIHAWQQMGAPESPTPLDLRLLEADAYIESGVNVSNRRNKAVKGFLESSDADWLWFVDGDQEFKPDTLHRMVATAHANDVKILGALIPIVTKTGLIPNVFIDHPEAITHVVLDPYHEDFGPPGPKEFAATGAGCIIIHRDVLEAMHADTGDHLSYFYEDRQMGGDGEMKWLGEDLSFCLRARQLGFPVIVDTSISVGHHKGVRTWWPEEIPAHTIEPEALDANDAVWMGRSKPAKVAAVIPVKDKLELTTHVVEQLWADPSVSHIIIVDNGSADGGRGSRSLAVGDEDHPWADDDHCMTWVNGEGMNIHEMWNRGIAEALEYDAGITAVAVLNNDLDLGPEAITTCARALVMHPEYAAVCPNYDGRPMYVGQIHPTGMEICAGRYDGTGGLAGFAMVIAADFLTGYRFPEDMTWWYGDNDLVLSVAKAGRKCGIVGGADIVHLDGGGQTGDWMSPEMREVTAADREVFLAKWSA